MPCRVDGCGGTDRLGETNKCLVKTEVPPIISIAAMFRRGQGGRTRNMSLMARRPVGGSGRPTRSASRTGNRLLMPMSDMAAASADGDSMSSLEIASS